MGNGHSQHQTVSAARRLAKRNKQKGLAGEKGQKCGGSKGTSTSKDYLFTFVRVNFSDFHPEGRVRFPQTSTAARNKHGRKCDVICARNKMKANILPKTLSSLRVCGQFRRTKIAVQRGGRCVQHQPAVGACVQMPLDFRLHSRRESSF